MIKIFSKNTQNLTSDIDTWIVEWITYKNQFMDLSPDYPKAKPCYQAFTNENEAIDLRNRINGAIKMIGITSLPDAKLYQQERNNVS